MASGGEATVIEIVEYSFIAITSTLTWSGSTCRRSSMGQIDLFENHSYFPSEKKLKWLHRKYKYKPDILNSRYKIILDKLICH